MKTTTYFDGGCPLCSKEIAHYRHLDRDARVHWVDITADAAALLEVGLDKETAMRRFHVRTADGVLLSGVPAFVALWRELPWYRQLARLVTWLRLTGPLDLAYARFADWRFKRRCGPDGCTIGAD
jgi:predicted DCC family thiol-disulfide oxidoreductase YuxK